MNEHQKTKLKQIKSVGIVLRPSTPEIKDIFLKVKESFEARGIEVFIDSLSAGMIKVLGMEFNTMLSKVDFVASIGGDGTLISTIRRGFSHNKPVIGINVGKLGFLTDISPDQVDEFIDALFSEDYVIDSRLVMEGELSKGDSVTHFFGFNDFVFTRRTISNTIKLQAAIDGKVFNTYKGDGLIISTPTGSTAYNMSSDGPILFPFTQAFIVNPICPHSLTQRPLVLPAHFEIEIDTIDDEGGMIIIDGQEIYEFDKGDKIKMKIASTHAKLLHRSSRDYFDVLKDKLNWGDI